MKYQPWVVVLSQSMMKVFVRDLESGDLIYTETIRNELGRVRSRFLQRHERGFIVTGGRQPSYHHAMDANRDAHAVASEAFAKRVAHFLENQRSKGAFASLTIVAEPKFLGCVRKELSRETLKTVGRWIPKDLEKATTDRIASEIQQAIQSERTLKLVQAHS